VEHKSKLACLLLFCVFGFMVVGPAHASPGVRVAIEPSEVKDVSVGATFVVNVTVTDVNEVYGWQVNVTFSPQVLNVESTSEGPFMKQLNETVFMKKIENTRGYALISASFKPPYPASGASGNGLLCNITFSVKSSGSSSLHFDSDGTKLNTIVGGSVYRIPDLSTADGSFGNPSGGRLSGIPLEWIGGIVAVVAVSGIVVLMLLRRRKRPRLRR